MTPEIERSLIKYLSKSASHEDLIQISNWLKDPKNKLVFKDFVQTNYAINYSVNNPDTNATRIAFQQGVKKQVKVRKLKAILKYAAAVVVFIAVSLGGYKQYYSSEIITEQALEQIKPGYDKATLVLSDGTTFNLDKQSNTVLAKNAVATISNTENGVVYHTDNKSETVNEVTKTPKYNTLHVPYGGMYQITLPDGTKVWLNSATTLSFPEQFIGAKRIVKLEGEAYFNVIKSTKPFVVQTNKSEIAVLGTQFNVSVYPDETFFSSTLVEGKVALTVGTISEKIILKPNERAVLRQDADKFNIKAVDVAPYIAWKDGKFYFESTSLDHIMLKMERWYHVDIVFEEEDLKAETFTGVVYKNRPIKKLLDMITKTTNLNYTITKKYKTEKYEITLKRQ